ncbi:PASTA domain-containing protein [Nocardioides speluncae]|uniref:PASTA domain-containing protein n=1 Tax=Nocardioides speluncae TaxID=2670337 RepID=UPI000D69C005|nr:PASTA domain-containing protein [Nocardioides speluncae]
MSDRDLTDLLERLGERVDVSPPPLAAMTRAADRTRRRRTAWVVGGAVAAAVALVAGGTQVIGDGLADGTDPRPPADRAVPAGMRLVGLGHAAIAVPNDWGRNEVGCGTPIKDTVVIDLTVTPACLIQRPADVDAVRINVGVRRGGEDIEIDGTAARRTPTTCSPGQNDEGIVTCSASIYVPSEGVGFEASSSTSRERVDEILDEVRILDDEVGVPLFDPLAGRVSADNYAERLRDAGLTMVKKWGAGQGPAGAILDVQPESGTVVEPGTQVTVTVNRPRSPLDQLELGYRQSAPQRRATNRRTPS